MGQHPSCIRAGVRLRHASSAAKQYKDGYPGQLSETMDRQLSRLVFKSPYEGHAFVNFVIPLVGTGFGSRA
jgi:hypothetical protein